MYRYFLPAAQVYARHSHHSLLLVRVRVPIQGLCYSAGGESLCYSAGAGVAVYRGPLKALRGDLVPYVGAPDHTNEAAESGKWAGCGQGRPIRMRPGHREGAVE